MLKTLKAIFATPKVATDVVGAVINGTDAAWWTKEERSEWFLTYLESTQPMNLARRLIALMVATVWLITALAMLVCVLLGHTEMVGELMLYMEAIVNPSFMAIMFFYFAKGIASSFTREKK